MGSMTKVLGPQDSGVPAGCELARARMAAPVHSLHTPQALVHWCSFSRPMLSLTLYSRSPQPWSDDSARTLQYRPGTGNIYTEHLKTS